MDEPESDPKSIRNVEALRISTEDDKKPPLTESVSVVREAPVTIDVEGVETYTVLCTPSDKRAMALGFLFSEGVVENMDEVAVLKHCDDDPNTIRVRLTGKVPRIDDAGRNLLIVSSCGACGSENLDERINALPKAGNTLRIKSELLRSINSKLREKQELFEACGGTHAAGLFDENGDVVSFAEDNGRHNALDKAIGKCLLAGLPTPGRGAALSGRVSLEMVGKCARAGIELITAVSAPTSLAIEVADKCNITLCCFVRETRATIFTYPSRIVGIDIP